jgi:ADP-heptose:LPS heptosyltransferase
VLKLDHYGDFIIGLPALRELRDAFPHATIRLVCGSWNKRSALAAGIADEVRCYNFFPEQPVHDTIAEPVSLNEFDEAVEGHHDIAFDLRVDEDTRHLLGRIDAGLRCGIGSVLQFPLLDIALPHEHSMRYNSGSSDGRAVYLQPDRFNSTLPIKGSLHQYGPLSPGDVLHGTFTEMPSGNLRVEIGLTLRGHFPGLRAASIEFEVMSGVRVIARRIYGRKSVFQLRDKPIAFEFDTSGQGSCLGFRVRVHGTPARGTLHFSGVTILPQKVAAEARYRPAELHIGEKLSLLVSLVRQRTTDLYGPVFPRPASEPEPLGMPVCFSGRSRIAVAPFSNSRIRDWPASYYASLISLLIERIDCEVILLGTNRHRAMASEITDNVQSPLLIDMIGRTTWDQLANILQTADLVICNNSGTAHQAAALGVRVLAIYSGSHQPREWGPRGLRAQALMSLTPCSPCGLESLADCTEGHACMRQITPEYVLRQAEVALAIEERPRL